MSRLIVTTIALPSITARRFSQCSTINSASRSMRSWAPAKRLQRHADLTLRRPSPAASAVAAFSSSSSAAFAPASSICQLDNSGFVVERLRGSVFNGLTHVVYIRVIPEDLSRVSVVALQRCSGKGYEGRFRQGICASSGHRPPQSRTGYGEPRLPSQRHSHAPRHDAVRLGELLDRREHHSARGAVQQRLEVLAGFMAWTGGSPSSARPAAKVSNSWSSRSLRSVIMTMVGLASSEDPASTSQPASAW